MSDIATYNEEFNKKLKSFFEQKPNDDHISLGYPDAVLIKIGLTNNEIRISTKTLKDKIKKHPELSSDSLKDLPLQLNQPLLVYKYPAGGINIILPAIVNTNSNQKGFILIGLTKNKKGTFFIYDIKTIHGRPFLHLLNWVNRDLLIYADIKKLEQLATGVTITPAIAELLQTILRKYNTKVTDKQIFLPENLSGIDWTDDLEGIQHDNQEEIITGFTGTTFTIGPGDVFRTLDTIENVIKQYHPQVRKLAPKLRGSTTLQTCHNIWKWCHDNIKYAYDTPGYEELRTPARSWNDRFTGIDCDDFTILTASILIELGYQPQLIMVGFNDSNYFSHILTALNCHIENNQPTGGIIIDPVDTIFNRTLSNISNTYIRNMEKIIVLNGIDTMPDKSRYYNGTPLPDNAVTKAMKNIKTDDKEIQSKINFIIANNNSLLQIALLMVLNHIKSVQNNRIIWKNEKEGKICNDFIDYAINLLANYIAHDKAKYGYFTLNSEKQYYKELSYQWAKTYDKLNQHISGLAATVTTVKTSLYDTRRYGYNKNNGCFGLVLGIDPADRDKLSAIPENKLHWAVVKVAGIGTKNGIPADNYWIVSDWWNDAKGKRGALYIVAEAGQNQINIPVTGATVEILDWVADNKKTAGGNAWKKNETKNYLGQIAGKWENIKTNYAKVLAVKQKIDEAGGDISKIIKETNHIKDWMNIYSDAWGHYIIAQACYNSLSSVKNSSQFNDICQATSNDGIMARRQLKDIFERFYNQEDTFDKIAKRLEDWQKVSNFEKAWQAVKTVIAAPLRGFFELMIKKNLFMVGAHLYALKKQNPAKYENIRNMYYGWGGNRTNFDKDVDEAKKFFDKYYHEPAIGETEDNNIIPPVITTAQDNTKTSVNDKTAEAVAETVAKKEIRMPQGIGVGVASAVTAATSGSAAPYAAAIAAAYEITATAVNSAHLKIGGVKNKNNLYSENIDPGTINITPEGKDNQTEKDNTLLWVLGMGTMAWLILKK